MIKSSFYLTILVLLVTLFACQSDATEAVTAAESQPVANAEEQVEKIQLKENSTDLSTNKTQQEAEIKEEKLARLETLKQQKAEILAKEEAAKEKIEAKLQKERKAQTAARKAKKIKEEEERRLSEKQAEEVQKFEEQEIEEPEELQGKLQFLKRSHDFGKIWEGDTFKHEFKFYNSSQIPVVISNVKASCGCTQTTFPKEPILPGEDGVIGVTFDSKGKLGRQKPFMSVVTNGSPSIYSLYMDGTVDTKRD